MSDRETSETVDSLTILTTTKRRLPIRRRTDVTVNPASTGITQVAELPTDSIATNQGCPLPTSQILQTLIQKNQPAVRDIVVTVTPMERAKLQSIAMEQQELLPELTIDK